MYYASIGINQVQAYLARSRRLWGRRGASDMLNYLTAREVEGSQERDFRTAKEVPKNFPDVDYLRKQPLYCAKSGTRPGAEHQSVPTRNPCDNNPTGGR